ncbi:unnamed protein product [Prunus armeniaca]|uniref:Uncharacterized protein n=1 Tax=Prunus armeniaca TaxID=36596 RepID=A0A6J5WEV5_PRUAR|nr:unnamed protein product [Prunus armeniaca]
MTAEVTSGPTICQYFWKKSGDNYRGQGIWMGASGIRPHEFLLGSMAASDKLISTGTQREITDKVFCRALQRMPWERKISPK